MRLAIMMAVLGMATILAGCGVRAKNVAHAQEQLQSLAHLVELYEVDRDCLPTNLNSLAWQGAFGGGYLKAKDSLVDPWGIAYRYSTNTHQYELRSAGPDREFLTGDDIILLTNTPNQAAQPTPRKRVEVGR